MNDSALVRADSVSIPLRDDSVDLIVTSPPYFALRSYQDGGEHYDGQIGSEPTPQAFLEALWAVTAECRRVLKPSGSLWVNLGDKYAGSAGGGGASPASTLGGGKRTLRSAGGGVDYSSSIPAKSLMGLPWRYAIGCIDNLDLILRAEVIWSKPNGLPESVTDRVRRSHEQWFHFTKEPRYFAAVDEVREAHTDPEQRRYLDGGIVGRLERGPSTPNRGMAAGSVTMDSGRAFGALKPNPLGKLPGSVWTIPSEPLKVPDHLGVDHFAAFPQEWPRRIILGWSPSGICTECGEGRRPVVAKEAHGPPMVRPALQKMEANGDISSAPSGSNVEHRITGYACSCPTPDAPTRPAIVLDPFSGTGTTVMVARALGRYGVGLDLSSDYLRLARWRVWDSGHASKTRERTNREAQGVLL